MAEKRHPLLLNNHPNSTAHCSISTAHPGQNNATAIIPVSTSVVVPAAPSHAIILVDTFKAIISAAASQSVISVAVSQAVLPATVPHVIIPEAASNAIISAATSHTIVLEATSHIYIPVATSQEVQVFFMFLCLIDPSISYHFLMSTKSHITHCDGLRCLVNPPSLLLIQLLLQFTAILF